MVAKRGSNALSSNITAPPSVWGGACHDQRQDERDKSELLSSPAPSLLRLVAADRAVDTKPPYWQVSVSIDTTANARDFVTLLNTIWRDNALRGTDIIKGNLAEKFIARNKQRGGRQHVNQVVDHGECVGL